MTDDTRTPTTQAGRAMLGNPFLRWEVDGVVTPVGESFAQLILAIEAEAHDASGLREALERIVRTLMANASPEGLPFTMAESDALSIAEAALAAAPQEPTGLREALDALRSADCDGDSPRIQSAIAALAAAPQEPRRPSRDELAKALGKRLLATGYEDFHVVEFSETGYGLQHPIECRPNLIGCIFNEWLASEMAPARDPGRYRMEWADDGPTLAALREGGER